MTTLFLLSTQKRYAMINKVSLSIIGRKHSKHLSVNAQAFVNGERVVIPLSIHIEPKYWDDKSRRVKYQHGQAVDYNAIISNAFDRATGVLRYANQKNIKLDGEGFRARFTSAISDNDFIAFWKAEHEARKGSIASGSWKQQKASLKKFTSFRATLPFDMLSPGLLEEYERYLTRRGNNINTIACALKNVKTYINLAIKREIIEKNPFAHHKIRQGQGRLTFLTIEELRNLKDKYNSNEIDGHLRESLLIFLVQAFTSIRISDAKNINENWIQLGVLEFMPFKTRKLLKVNRFGLSQVALKLLADLFALKKLKKLKTEKQINIDLKLIAALAGIRKNLTTHVARHTFATTFLAIGGRVEVLKDIMGHSRMETTMRYVHVVDNRKTEQMGNFDIEFK